MQLITALFRNKRDAEAAHDALMCCGVNESDISFVAPGDYDEAQRQLSNFERSHGSLIGAATGAGVGTLAGLATLAIPGFSEVAITGWLAALMGGALAGTAFGAAAGTMREVMQKAGINEHEAQYFAQEVARGAVLVTARVLESDAPRLRAVLEDFNAIRPEISPKVGREHRAKVDESKSPYMQAHRQAQRERGRVNHTSY